MSLEVDVAFLFLGGAHQVLHVAPVAAKLTRIRPHTRVACICPDEETFDALAEVRRQLDAPALRINRIDPPAVAQGAARFFHNRSLIKLPLLAKLRLGLQQARAIVVPERTSALLRYMGWQRPLIHFRHGAGDRAPKSENRLSAFDLVVVAGEKDIQRALQQQHLEPERLRSCGYVKLDYLNAAQQPVSRPFADDRPIVVYNPHFDASISSLPVAREVIARFAAQSRYHLIVAPHIRLSETMSTAEMSAWHSLAVPDHILIDLHSPHLLNMDHLRVADVYLGDMSSQLYEYLAQPRPAVFINAHARAWHDDPRYAGWHLGEVANKPAEVLATIDRAIAEHGARIDLQKAAVEQAFGAYQGASERGALIVAEALDRELANADGPPE